MDELDDGSIRECELGSLSSSGRQGDKRIIDFPYREISPTIRVYYAPYEVLNGFCFWVIEWAGCGPGLDFFDEHAWAKILYHGVAFFDGIRHMYMGDERTDNEGYIHYPSLEDHVKIFQVLRELELKYCPHAEPSV